MRTIKPILKIGNHDYTAWLAEDGLAPVRNDIDADGSGRNLLDGLMYRARIAQKDKWTVKFNRMPELIMRSRAADVDGDGKITVTDALLILQKAMAKIDAFPVEK